MMDEYDYDIFDRNIDQLDVRETPRWELSEEEPSDDSDVETLINQQRKNAGQISKQAVPQASIPAATPMPGNSRPSMALTDQPQSPKVPQRQGAIAMAPNTGIPQSPLLRKAASGPRSSTSTTESVKTVMSPVLNPRQLDKKKIDELVKAAYADDGDSVKDFGAVERETRPNTKIPKASLTDAMTTKIAAGTTDVMSKLPPWEDDDADSLKDYTSNDRKKEEKYMERTDEAIYQRASEEHIKRPPLWHDDEVDSLRDFGHISGKQEMPSGIASQQLSRLPSDEDLCLSPPWNDEDDGQVRNLPCTEADHKSYAISKMVVEQRIRQAPPWHEEDDADSTRDYSQFWKSRSIENSRRPSDENIYLTPPWMEDDRESCGNHSASSHMTLEEKRAIEEEARTSGINEAGAKAQALRDEKQGTAPQIPGRDSGFCSEQDQHGQQPPQATTDIPEEEEGIEADFPTSQNDQPVSVTSVQPPISVAPPQSSAVPLPQGHTKSIIAPLRPPLQDIPVLQEQEVPVPTPLQMIEAPRIVPQIPPDVKHKVTEDPRLIHPLFHDPISIANRGVRQQSLEVPHTMNKQEQSMMSCIPRIGSTDARMYNMGCLPNKGIARSVSQSSLEANCYSPHDALEGLETSSVVSFASTAATHHDLDTRIDMMQSLISLLGTHDKDDMSRTLLAMSNSRDSCAAMRQSGCLPLLIDLIHGHDNPMARRDCRARAGLALHNIVYSNPEDRRGRREIRVLRLLEIVRAHCDAILYSNLPPHPCAERWYPPLRDYGPGPAVAALMKLSFEEEHRNAICELGGLQAIAELVEIDNKVNAECYDSYSIGLRKYAGMTLTNLTFGNTKNKTILCKMEKAVKALISQLRTPDEEELVQVSASVLRNLSWRADDISRESLRKVGAVKALTEAAQKVHGEPALRTLLSGLWNLSAHCPENKTELCNVSGALKFIVKSLNYCSPSGNISVVESSGGILRNLSSHIAVRQEYRQVLRENGCFHTLLSHLRSPSLRVVSNACGALWNLSARCIEDQELLWELGVVSLLKSLVSSKHKAIATASSAALRNLMTVKPTSSNGTDSESVSSRNARRYRSMPPGTRQVDAQAKLRSSSRGVHSPGVRSCHSSPHSQTPTSQSPKTQSPKVQSPRPKSPVVHLNQRPHQAPHHVNKEPIKNKHQGSALSLDHVGINHKNNDRYGEFSPGLMRSRSDIGTVNSKRREKTGINAVAMDSSSVGSAASIEGRHCHLGRWSGSNDSLARHRKSKNVSRQPNSEQAAETGATKGGQHSRSSSDGCAVIQLLTDSYPLQVTAKLNTTGNPTVEGFNSRPRQVIAVSSRPSGSHSDSTSVVSPATARRLNQWAEEQAIESIEMSQLYICKQGENQGVPNPQVAASRESMGSNASRQRRKQAQRFRSFRDSDSEREGDIDSDDEQNVFGSKGGFGNAWVNKTGSNKSGSNKTGGKTSRTGSKAQSSKRHSQRLDTTGSRNPQCSCKNVSNIWIKRGKSKGKGVCENCMKENQESRGGTADSRPVVKSRRDSSDSPLSSPNAMRGFMANIGHEDLDTDPSKRGVKVTSL